MRRLPEKFARYGEQFEQVCRRENTAIYLRHINGRQKSYEVIVIRVTSRKAVKTNGVTKWAECEPYECYPSTEKWGESGWTYPTEESARKKYDLINRASSERPDCLRLSKRPHASDGNVQDAFLSAGCRSGADKGILEEHV